MGNGFDAKGLEDGIRVTKEIRVDNEGSDDGPGPEIGHVDYVTATAQTGHRMEDMARSPEQDSGAHHGQVGDGYNVDARGGREWLGSLGH